ncbi:MAG: CheB methylesterase domain-containing protein [Armatimonadota bacterium]|nr:CheB methylesterase domain-containing protein [Armatimonadota bacterium]
MQQIEDAAAETGQKILAPRSIVVIGAATGGVAALTNITSKMPNSFPASIIIVQQMRPGFTRLLATYLSKSCGALVEEAENHQLLKPNQVLMTPGCHGITIAHGPGQERPFIVSIENQTDSAAKSRTRIDIAMQSAAEMFGSRTIGILLTGVGTDGRDGMKAIREKGGTTIVQDQDSSILFDMPKAAIDAGVVDEILPLWNIADRLIELMGDD